MSARQQSTSPGAPPKLLAAFDFENDANQRVGRAGVLTPSRPFRVCLLSLPTSPSLLPVSWAPSTEASADPSLEVPTPVRGTGVTCCAAPSEVKLQIRFREDPPVAPLVMLSHERGFRLAFRSYVGIAQNTDLSVKTREIVEPMSSNFKLYFQGIASHNCF